MESPIRTQEGTVFGAFGKGGLHVNVLTQLALWRVFISFGGAYVNLDLV